MDRKPMYVQWKILFYVLLFVMMVCACVNAELPQRYLGNVLSQSDDNIFLIINPADIRVNSEGLMDPGVLVIEKHVYEKNYQDMLDNLGSGGVIWNPGERAIAESGMTDKASELANKYDPANPDNPLNPQGGGAGDLFNQKSGIEDALAGSPFDPSKDSTGNLLDRLTGNLDPLSAKGTGGTILSSEQGNNRNKGGTGFSYISCISDSLPREAIGPKGDYCWIIQSDSNGDMSSEDAKMGTEAADFAADMEEKPVRVWVDTNNFEGWDGKRYEGWGWYAEGTTWWGDWSKNKAPGNDDGTGASDPNTAGYKISGVYIEQKDNLDEVANSGGELNPMNNKFKWLIDAAKQPGFHNPSGGGYEVGDAGLGGDVGIVTYDRTGLPRINTEKKIPWYLQPAALPKDMGYASEVAETAEESRTYEFSGEKMMVSSEAMGGLKAGDTVNNVAGGGAVRP